VSWLISPSGGTSGFDILNAALSISFIRHLDDLRCWLLRYRKIHVICDNDRIHDFQPVQRYLRRWDHRLVLHYLPTYAPEAN